MNYSINSLFMFPIIYFVYYKHESQMKIQRNITALENGLKSEIDQIIYYYYYYYYYYLFLLIIVIQEKKKLYFDQSDALERVTLSQ